MTASKTARCALPLVLLATLAAGCSSEEYASDYTLNIVPRPLGGQTPLADGAALKLFIKHADARRELIFLGNAEGDKAQRGDFPPIQAGSVVGLIVEEAGGPEDSYNPDLLVAYGEIDILEDLTNEQQQVELQILLPEVHSPGRMEDLTNPKKTLWGGVALADGGDTYLFGGVKEFTVNEAAGRIEGLGTDRISWMTNTDEGEWDFTSLDVELCEPASAFSTTRIEVEGQELILLAGGRSDWARPDADSVQLDMLCMFDPVAQEVVFGDKARDAKLPSPRSDHSAITLDDGKVLLFGGYQVANGDSIASYDIFDPTQREVVFSGVLDMGGRGVAGASLGPDGALICGGATERSDVMEPSTTCNIITLTGNVREAPRLPIPLWNHAMVELPEGRVLVAGGNTDPGIVGGADNLFEAVDAVRSAYVYNGNSWQKVDDMNEVRAHFAMLPTPGGDIVVVGGTTQGGAYFPDLTEAVLCTEVFDPDLMEFTTDKGSCTAAGSGAMPMVGRHPIEGAFVLQGFTSGSNEWDGGKSFGMLAFGPDIRGQQQ